MTPRGYREEELVANRASVLLSGGTEDERRTWAATAARNFSHEGPLVEVRQSEQVSDALRKPRGVLFIPDVARLSFTAQGLIVRCLQTQEERPKIVVGLSGAVENARSKGTLREDLLYRLHLAQVDLTVDGMRELMVQRRAQLVADEAARKAEAERLAAEKAAQMKAAGISVKSPRMRSKVAPRATSPKVTRR
ncbi:Fis family transcriptional regulator [Vitiosangium sp. GDMCC 1.1324]|uniref:Fis family transcriptional regulator n=1 Tax=Vitiosangium sp. (strain GDMCC 1.1324) TaxID=2138576 RepID=UPI000D3DB07D|nr:Fis family transcriptional regulator [Vitiosangium sp. GDMCC 1.1324]PTL79620.1 Fis family transcriptional regulator [Vitiosangium sp. GDMCC 1.1324]